MIAPFCLELVDGLLHLLECRLRLRWSSAERAIESTASGHLNRTAKLLFHFNSNGDVLRISLERGHARFDLFEEVDRFSCTSKSSILCE